MTASTDERAPQRRRPPGRYDEPSRAPARFLAVIMSVLFLGLLAAIAFYLYSRYGSAQVPVQERGFDVVSDREVRVDFRATPPPGETAWCLVRARGASGAEVGLQYVAVRQRPGSSAAVDVRHVLPTTSRAVTGEVPRCDLAAPPEGAPTAQPDP